MLAGRDFTAADKRGAPSVAIVNEAFARKFTGGANPMGRRVREPARPSSPNPEREIVGYVADAAYRSLREPVPATMYLPVRSEHGGAVLCLDQRAVRDGFPRLLLTKGLASALTGVNRGVAITFRPIADQIDASLTQERLVAMLSGFFGVLALLLSALGLYGVTSYAVSRRRSEIGMRMALGAAPSGVVGMVLGRVALLVTLGVVAGLGTSLWASKFVTPLLYGLQPRDPITMTTAALVLGAIGARIGRMDSGMRASRFDPARGRLTTDG